MKFSKKITSPFLIVILFASLNLYSHTLTINVFASKNGKGLEMDQKILAEALTQIGCKVNCLSFDSPPTENFFADVNIFFQFLPASWFPYAPQNWFIPNPEWYCHEISLLKKIDLILCRTRTVEKIFKELNKKTFFLGFTSQDCYDPLVKKDYKLFFHLAGGSSQKGTLPIIKIWEKNSQLPLLTLIKWDHQLKGGIENLNLIPQRINAQILSKLQNSCGIHLCPSEAEGFGHYIMEALSTKAVVVTTDAPPMNEFVSDFLIPYQSCEQQRLGTNYYVNQEALESTIQLISKMSKSKLKSIGNKNRKFYLRKADEFKKNLNLLILKASNDSS